MCHVDARLHGKTVVVGSRLHGMDVVGAHDLHDADVRGLCRWRRPMNGQ